MAVHTIHAVFSNMSLVHKFSIRIFIEFVIFKVALEAPVFSDLAVAENYPSMTAFAFDFIPDNGCMIIFHSRKLFLGLSIKVMARFTFGKFIIFMFRVIRFVKVAVEAGIICNLHMRALDNLRVAACAFQILTAAKFREVVLVIKQDTPGFINSILNRL
jgi:hypothetical protein